VGTKSYVSKNTNTNISLFIFLENRELFSLLGIFLQIFARIDYMLEFSWRSNKILSTSYFGIPLLLPICSFAFVIFSSRHTPLRVDRYEKRISRNTRYSSFSMFLLAKKCENISVSFFVKYKWIMASKKLFFSEILTVFVSIICTRERMVSGIFPVSRAVRKIIFPFPGSSKILSELLSAWSVAVSIFSIINIENRSLERKKDAWKKSLSSEIFILSDWEKVWIWWCDTSNMVQSFCASSCTCWLVYSEVPTKRIGGNEVSFFIRDVSFVKSASNILAIGSSRLYFDIFS